MGGIRLEVSAGAVTVGLAGRTVGASRSARDRGGCGNSRGCRYPRDSGRAGPARTGLAGGTPVTARAAVVRIVCDIHAVSIAEYQAGFTCRGSRNTRFCGATLPADAGLAGLAGVHAPPAVPHVRGRINAPAVAPDLQLRAGAGRCPGIRLAGGDREAGSPGHERAGTVFLRTSGTDGESQDQANDKKKKSTSTISHNKGFTRTRYIALVIFSSVKYYHGFSSLNVMAAIMRLNR